jgi:hypothetical protein
MLSWSISISIRVVFVSVRSVAIAGHPRRLAHVIGGDGGAWAAGGGACYGSYVGGAALEFYWMQVLVLSLSSTFCDLLALTFHVGIQYGYSPL